jgi:isochorismate synthase EntC
MSDFIFMQTSPETITVGSGALTFSDKPHPSTQSFYLNNFFLQKETPWIIPQFVEQLTIPQFQQQFLGDANQTENIAWQASDDQKFRKFFQKIKQAIDEGLLEKIVPVSFESGSIPTSWDTQVLSILTNRFIQYLSSDLYLFGFQHRGVGLCGLTPELIFEQEHNYLCTAALAGTQASQFGDRSIKNPKDIREHQLVIDDITTQLKPFGSVHTNPTTPYWNGSLIHLRAKIEVQTTHFIAFDDLIKALHPTAALGAYPRTENAKAILKGSDTKIPRGYFASPFGVFDPQRERSLCVAAIRSVFWEEHIARIGAGCGIIEESDVDSEIAELALKRKSIRDKISC